MYLPFFSSFAYTGDRQHKISTIQFGIKMSSVNNRPTTVLLPFKYDKSPTASSGLFSSIGGFEFDLMTRIAKDEYQ